MSDLGSFSQCLVEGDVEALGRARKLRRKALSASIVLELMLVVALLLLPLITAGVPPKIYTVTPLPPYSGSHNAAPTQPRTSPHPPAGELNSSRPIYQSTPTRPDYSGRSSSSAPDVGPGIPDANAADAPTPGILGGTGPALMNVPPPTERNEKKRKVHIELMEASLIHRVDPEYPAIARQMHLTGEVQLRATIATDGTIKDWVVLSGNPIFLRNTIEAIRQWRYRPTVLDGDPVEVETMITVRFVMN
jgi:periplasmic protein TonB